MNYRHLNRQKTLAFGTWPDVTLAEARAKRDGVRKQISQGIDPAETQRLDHLSALLEAENTFKAIAEEWVTKNEREGRAPVTLDKIRWLLNITYPTLGGRPINKISPQEVLLVLRKVEATGRISQVPPTVALGETSIY
ncbi:hypothetical protein SPHINGOAX6_30123 [Sphingomonas sp. AX6]|nr:hypothetical protein SPHINGOAX6_30123 [Sphingomonas sp. AX6]